MDSNHQSSTDLLMAMRNLMIYANFSGLIHQSGAGRLAQFSVGEPCGGVDEAYMMFDFGDRRFKMTISLEARCSIEQT